MILSKTFSNGSTLACDGNCTKAWGINRRPFEKLSENPDDVAYLADHELGEAPSDPGTYEGGYGKPSPDGGPNRQNKWCYRECERSDVWEVDEKDRRLPNFSERLYNIPASRPA